MNDKQADDILKDAFSKGVGWAGVDVSKGRPMVGCDPSDPVANQAFNDVMAAFKDNQRAMDRALFKHILDLPYPEQDEWVVVRALGEAPNRRNLRNRSLEGTK
ncbi:MAG: hypothetical protein EVA65_16025 [Oceanococcus sp.]|nr:MAG: hypothetical protein EVA65_16025 [Oceanococcus sp.]